MVESRTTRVALPQWSAGTDSGSRSDFNEAFLNLEEQVALALGGTRAARPAAEARRDRTLYYCTDTQEIFWCTGSAWNYVGRVVANALMKPVDKNGVGLTVQAAASDQVEAVMVVLNSGGTRLVEFAPAGQKIGGVYTPYRVGGGFVANVPTAASHNVATQDANSIGQITRGQTSQVADLEQWQNAAGSVLARVRADGSLSTIRYEITGTPTASDAVPKSYVDAQIATRAASVHTHPDTDISTSTATGRSLITASDAAAARNVVGLSNVNNTSDVDKPISTAQQTALNGKANTTHTHTISQISDRGSTGASLLAATTAASAKTTLGLGQVNNTSDVDKPVSNAQQTALDGKANASHTHPMSQISDSTATGRSLLAATSATDVRNKIGLSNVDNTSDVDKPVSAAVASALDLKMFYPIAGIRNVVIPANDGYKEVVITKASLGAVAPLATDYTFTNKLIFATLEVNSIYPYTVQVWDRATSSFTLRVYRPTQTSAQASMKVMFWILDRTWAGPLV